MICTMFRNDDAHFFAVSHYAPEKTRNPFRQKRPSERKKIPFDLGFQNKCNGARAHFEWGKDSHKVAISHMIRMTCRNDDPFKQKHVMFFHNVVKIEKNPARL